MTLLEQIAEAEENNEHTEAVMIKARAMDNALGAAYLVILEEIAATHELNGSLSLDHYTLRYSIDREITANLKARGIL